MRLDLLGVWFQHQVNNIVVSMHLTMEVVATKAITRNTPRTIQMEANQDSLGMRTIMNQFDKGLSEILSVDRWSSICHFRNVLDSYCLPRFQAAVVQSNLK